MQILIFPFVHVLAVGIMAQFPLSFSLAELLMLRIAQGQKLGLCVDKELERIIAEQCLCICLRGKAIATRPSRSGSFTSE